MGGYLFFICRFGATHLSSLDLTWPIDEQLAQSQRSEIESVSDFRGEAFSFPPIFGRHIHIPAFQRFHRATAAPVDQNCRGWILGVNKPRQRSLTHTHTYMDQLGQPTHKKSSAMAFGAFLFYKTTMETTFVQWRWRSLSLLYFPKKCRFSLPPLQHDAWASPAEAYIQPAVVWYVLYNIMNDYCTTIWRISRWWFSKNI